MSTGINTFFPTYYTVTWNGASPTNYNALTGTGAGGVDSASAIDILNQVWIVGTASAPTTTVGHSIVLNGVEIIFTGTSLASAIADINKETEKTGVVADSVNFTGYLTLSSVLGVHGISITTSAGVGTALSDLGFNQNEIWSAFPNTIGNSWSNIAAGNAFLINGVPVVLTATSAPTAVAAAINQGTLEHNVVARASAAGLQLASADGQPFMLTDGVAGNVAKMGFTAGVQTTVGVPMALNDSINKEFANMRWRQMLLDLSNLTSPSFTGWINRSNGINAWGPVASLSFTIAYDRPDYLQIADQFNPGTSLTGAAAIKRAIALSLSNPVLTENRKVFDPSITFFGALCNRANPSQIMGLSATGLDTDILALEANIQVVANTSSISNI